MKQQTRSRSSKATVANDDTKTKIVVGYQSRVQVTNSGRNTLVKSIPSTNVKKKLILVEEMKNLRLHLMNLMLTMRG